jgi:glycosyltransferase involved in cell wall biosynthesis
VLDWLNLSTPHRQAVAFLSRSNDELLDEFRRTGSDIIFIEPIPAGLRKIRHIRREIAAVCRQVKPDVVISWTTGMSQWVHLGARKAGVRNLLTHAGNPPYGKFVQRFLYTYMSFWIGTIVGAKTVVPSEYIMSEFRKIPFLKRNDFHKVFNCVNVTRFLRPSDRNPSSANAIMVATLEQHKDHRTLLKAWREVSPDKTPGELLIAGKGALGEQLEQLSKDLRADRLKFLGARSDIPELLWKCKVFVLSTTDAEGFGTVLIEALAAGLQIVATDVPACREVLQGGKYGTLVPPSDARALSKAIEDAFSSNETFEVNKRVAYSKQFSPLAMMNGYLRLLE